MRNQCASASGVITVSVLLQDFTGIAKAHVAHVSRFLLLDCSAPTPTDAQPDQATAVRSKKNRKKRSRAEAMDDDGEDVDAELDGDETEAIVGSLLPVLRTAAPDMPGRSFN